MASTFRSLPGLGLVLLVAGGLVLLYFNRSP